MGARWRQPMGGEVWTSEPVSTSTLDAKLWARRDGVPARELNRMQQRHLVTQRLVSVRSIDERGADLSR